MSKIQSSQSLLSFAANYAAMKVTNDFVNTNTGETFKSCAFEDQGGNVTLVGFSTKLGIDQKLPAQTIAALIAGMKNDLQVVSLLGDDNKVRYKLCKKGQDTWATIAL